MFKKIATIAFVILLGSAVPLSAQQPAPVKRTILQKVDVSGGNLEMIYAIVEIVPNFKAGRHSHPGVVMAQIVEGEFWYAQDGQPEKVFKAGDVMTVPDHAIHNEGATDKALKMNVVYVVEKGQPLASPAK